MSTDTGDPAPISWFVASFLPKAAARRLARLASALPHPVQPRAAEELHLTWRSFDAPAALALPAFDEALAGVASRHRPVTVELLGGGVFAGGSVWARACLQPALRALQADVDRALTALGLPRASHPFVPHVTLGAGPAGTRAPTFLHDLATRFTVDELVLTCGGTQPEQAVHRFPLGT